MPRWSGRLALLLVLGSATAAPAEQEKRPSGDQASAYRVEGVGLGDRFRLGSSAYRDYKCARSEQFDGLTWCQKSGQDRERRGPFTASYSILHDAGGRILYVNRYQEPAFFGPNEAKDDIESYARKFGETPEIIQVPHRSGQPHCQLALWGNVVLKVLDSESMKIVADGKSPKKGMLIDCIGDFTRSVKEGLPVYRVSGGAGFVWVASFDERGRGTLRFVAVDASRLAPQN
jgi:hypothetical protein